MVERNRTSATTVTTVTAVLGMGMVAGGVWAVVAPHSFADFVAYPPHVHFLHDSGAFMIGLGIGLLLALIWADALATVLAGFLVANTVHVVNHIVDHGHGGVAWQTWALGVASVGGAVALALRVRGHGFVVGQVTTGTIPELARFVRQKTITLTTYRRDGAPGRSPVSIAVDGDHAYIRSFEQSLKTKRLRRDPMVEIAACTARGRPTGEPALAGRMRRLEGAEYRHAARILRRKYPLLHGLLVPLAHRLGRGKLGRTVHFEFATPVTPPAPTRSQGRAADSALRWSSDAR